ncbi:translocation protein Sec62-domain-containing protein [Mucor mucedo]|uniref:translocation protein Sec62-domain-containing protein n=1 Tax=Mucor mucedo TaxID=29922 RepID=UPI00221F8C8C|nr:translocation protein Sec62-domain-containing protein [Mucor mucedo]KAI7868688.1 translocation protein Sec62-domain-containing protein [Mucor mucedo]
MSHQHGPGCNHGPSNGSAPQTIQVNDANKAPALYKNTATYLKDEKKSGLKARQGVFNGKRFEYFKGKRGIEALLKENYAKVTSKGDTVPKTRDEAFNILNDLGKYGFVLRVDRGESIGGKGSPRLLQPNPVQEIKEDGYYMWIWEGSRFRLYAGAAALVATILAGVLFPLWPNFLRMGVWYLSVAVLCLVGVFFGIAIVRLILYVLTLPVLPRGFWLFPNLFEDVGIIDSFIPLYGFDPVKEKKTKKSDVTAAQVVEKSE